MQSTVLCSLVLATAAVSAQEPGQGVAGVPRSTIERVTRSTVERAAKRIDALVGKALVDAGQRPNSMVDDATFVRRIHLQIIGRIPTGAETKAFLGEARSDKREALIDRLLESKGHVSHEFNYWADLLRVRSRLMRQTSGEPFAHWLKESIAAAKPYDEMVREMVTAEGPAHERGNGATGMLLRDLGMPEDSMANTVRVFLGTRLECAQCHNHPFDRWTRMEFYRMTAFSGGLQYRTRFEQTEVSKRLQSVGRKMMQEHGRQAQRALRQLALPVAVGLNGGGSGLVRLPKDYQYDDAKPRQAVVAQTIFGEQVSLGVQQTKAPQRSRGRRQRGRGAPPLGKDIDSRAAFAEWLTSPDNPRFTTVVANRTWQRVMGRGLIEPVDNMRDDTDASHPELMGYLAGLVVELDFDVRQLQRVLFYTRAYQRQASTEELATGEVYRFPGPLLRRVSAAQMWDSLLTLVVGDLDAKLAGAESRAEQVYQQYERISALTPKEIEEQLDVLILRYTDPPKFRAIQRERLQKRAKERRATQKKLQGEVAELRRQITQARRKKDHATAKKLTAELQQLTGDNLRQRRDLARASELQQPAPPGHILREFGQSDREQVEGGHREASVPQVLMLLNGLNEQRLLGSPQSVLRREIDAAKSPRAKIEAVYLTVLSRKPDATERREWQRAFGADAEGAVRDLVWVLINSHEFRFLR